MELFVALLALALDRWTGVARWRCFACFSAYQKRVQGWMICWPVWAVCVGLLLPVVAVGVLDAFIGRLWLGLLNSILGVGVLVYCLGPQSVFRDAVSSNDDRQTVLKHGHDQYFAVLLWFMLFGMAGCVLYRLVCLVDSRHAPETRAAAVDQARCWLKKVLDWLPSRLLSLTFALVGHFMRVFSAWRAGWLKSSSEALLDRCGQAALEGGAQSAEASEAACVVALLDRALIVWLIVFALAILL